MAGLVCFAVREQRATSDKYSRDLRKMTPEVLQAICKERHMWAQPHLNTQLFLNYRGFDAIESLEDYTSVRSLHLGNNNIRRIDGLDRMSDLVSLHLEANSITRIENLSANLQLRHLNLECNGITCVEGLSHLCQLEELNLSRNRIENLENLEPLREVKALSNIDVSHNQIVASEGVIEFWTSLPSQIRLLRYHGNPGVRHIKNYRKHFVNALPQLGFLDERPINSNERKCCAAWAKGGMEAMHQAKREIYAQRHRQDRQVDPDRREHLTRMRKLAMARIEREAREREELENQRANGGPRQQQQQEAKDGEESQQQQHQEREQDASAASRYSNGNNSASSSAAQPGLTFRPAPRVSGRSNSEAAAWGPDASNFIVRWSDSGSDLADRQFSVLADEDHGNSGCTNSAMSHNSPATAVADNLETELWKQSKDVMPLIWEKMAERQKEGERECLELQNQVARVARAASRESEATSVGDIRRNEELNGLD